MCNRNIAHKTISNKMLNFICFILKFLSTVSVKISANILCSFSLFYLSKNLVKTIIFRTEMHCRYTQSFDGWYRLQKECYRELLLSWNLFLLLWLIWNLCNCANFNHWWVWHFYQVPLSNLREMTEPSHLRSHLNFLTC